MTATLIMTIEDVVEETVMLSPNLGPVGYFYYHSVYSHSVLAHRGDDLRNFVKLNLKEGKLLSNRKIREFTQYQTTNNFDLFLHNVQLNGPVYYIANLTPWHLNVYIQ